MFKAVRVHPSRDWSFRPAVSSTPSLQVTDDYVWHVFLFQALQEFIAITATTCYKSIRPFRSS